MDPQKLRYRLYIDESGDHALNMLDDPSRRYLALLGVWFDQEQYILFADALDKLKRHFFGPRPDRPVSLHRSDIINRKGPFVVLRDDAIRQQFDDELVKLVSESQFTLICVLIDKKQQSNRYAGLSSPFSLHPYHFCLAAMLYRYSRWLLAKDSVGDVMAESRGREEDLQLKNAYKNVYESGTNSLGHDAYQRALTSKEIKLQPKRACIAGLELADILAHPIKIACLHEKLLITEPLAPFGQRLCGVAFPKFLVGGNGAVENHGWMCF
ncbi:MAG TPA: DUF3800 domain-containing protein [Phycisphaerae bacterium]|nr:DUF3800 domain-containing protein [Phycisphaerae bacterium]